jgi:single-strand DNA-binding protein
MGRVGVGGESRRPDREDAVSDTIITIQGNVATDPQFKVVGEGIPRCSFRLASSTRRRESEDGPWVDGPTSWYTVTAWRGLAENLPTSVFKGDPIIVTGRLQVREWTTEERSGTSVEIDAATIGHDLQRGQSRFTRVTRRPRVPAGEEVGADRAATETSNHRGVGADGAIADGGVADGAIATGRIADGAIAAGEGNTRATENGRTPAAVA